MAILRTRSQKQQKEPTLPPLLDYVEKIEREIHQNPDDKLVEALINDNFSPDLLFEENAAPLNLASYKLLSSTFRQSFLAVRVTDRRPAVYKTDPLGKGGVVGFATLWLFRQKSDKELFAGDSIEIFEVAWVPENGEPLGGRRLITKAQIAIGDLTPVKKAAATKLGKRTARRGVASGRVSKATRR